MALDLGTLTEDTVVPDSSQRRLRDVDAVDEDSPADSNTHQPPDHVLGGRAVERVEIESRMDLPQALDQPEPGVVDGADRRLQRVERFDAPLHQGVVDRGEHEAERDEDGRQRVREHIVKLEGGQVDDQDEEDAQPPCEEEQTDSPKVVPILRPEAATQRLPRPEMVESAVPLDRSRNLEARGAQ